jgi:hypothetical protein
MDSLFETTQLLNCYLSQKLKLTERGKYKHLTTTLTLSCSNSLLMSKTQNVEYLIEM